MLEQISNPKKKCSKRVWNLFFFVLLWICLESDFGFGIWDFDIRHLRFDAPMTFRRRILIAMVPLFVLLVALGTTGTILIYHLGNQVDEILRENYDSVVFMRDLNEALERIDSSFQFALAGREEQSHEQYQENWEEVPGVPRPRTAQHHASRRKRIGRPLERSLQRIPQARRHFLRTVRTAIARPSTSAKTRTRIKARIRRRPYTRYFRRSRPSPATSSA